MTDLVERLRLMGLANPPLREAADEIERLRAIVAELEKDAKRYLHMKSNATFQDRNGPGLYWYLPRCNRELPIGERLDAAIDAAMREGE